MTTTIGMWEMVSELLEGEKLPMSMNEALKGLCNGDLVIAERHEFRKLEADNHALKTQIELLRKPVELTNEEINVVAILQDAEIVPVGHEIWKTGEEFNKYKRIVLATAKALRKAQEK